MFRQTLKMVFVGLAAIDISRERLEQCLSSMVAKAIGV